MWNRFSLVLCASFGPLAAAQSIVFDQPLAPNLTARPSQLWIDPSGQNDSDLDAIAWEDFVLDRPTTVTRVRWWGETAPSLGFRIRFYPQDPNTIAIQPDMFRPGAVGALLSETHEQVTWLGSDGLYQHYEVTLDTPLELEGDTRYFLSVVAREPQPFIQWKWAAGDGLHTGTFYWSRGDTNTYRHMPEDRAMSIIGDACGPDLNGDGVLDFFDAAAFLSAFASEDPDGDWASPIGVFDFFDVAAFLAAFSAGCP